MESIERDNKTEISEKHNLLNLYNNECLYSELLKKYEWAESYIYYYIFVVYAVRNSIIPILDSISEEDRYQYTAEKAYRYLRSYEKKRLSFVTIIPTCNRPKAIQYLLNYAAVLYRRYAIDVIIYDSSDNDETKSIVEDMRDNGYYNVIYKRYEGIYDGFSLDHKIISAYSEFSDEYDYLWLCRDGLIPVVDEIIEKIRYYAKQKVGCIIVDTKSRTQNIEIEKEYSTRDDCEKLLLEHASRLQTLGMLIFSGTFAKRLVESVQLDDKTYSLWQMAAPFHLFAKEPYRVVFFTKNLFAPNYCASSTHFWSKAEKALRQWSSLWKNVIEKMPDEYANAKDKCMMVYTVDFHPFTIKNVLEMRGWGGLTLKMVKQYENDLRVTTKTPIWCFRLIACLPRVVARCAKKIIGRFPTETHKIRNIIFGDKR